MITTGEGGAVTTNDKQLWKKLLAYRSHGVERNLTVREKKLNHGYLIKIIWVLTIE